MARALYQANTFMFAPNKTILYVRADKRIWLIVSDVLKSIKDTNTQITGARLVPCTVQANPQDKAIPDYLIEKDDLCAYLINMTQSFKASLLAQRLQEAQRFEAQEATEESLSDFYVEADFSDSSKDVYFADSAQEIPAVYEFNYNEFFIRAIIQDQQIWFVAFDVFRKILGIDTDSCLAQTTSKERGQAQIKSLDDIQEMKLISEAGLQQVFAKLIDRMPEVRKLKRWIDWNVLPSLSKVINQRSIHERSRQIASGGSAESVEGNCTSKGVPDSKPIKLWVQIIHNNVPLDIYQGDGTWWFKADQIEMLLGYTAPYIYLRQMYNLHKDLFQTTTRLCKITGYEGQREVCRERRMWSIEGLREVFKRMEKPQEKAILQDLSKKVGKLIKKDIYFRDAH